MLAEFEFGDVTETVSGPHGVTSPSGEPGCTADPYVVLLAGADVGRVFRLKGSRCIIGRSPDAQIVLEDNGISRHHATLQRGSDGTVRVTDLGSRNGTWVDGRNAPVHMLEVGAEFALARAFRFRCQPA